MVRLEGGSAPAWASSRALDLFLHADKRRELVGDGDAGLTRLAELAAEADIVVVEGKTADAVTDLGFDEWAAPVKVAITPFGRTGPKCNWRATPHTLLAMGGYTNLIGDPDRAPLSLPGHYVEFQSGGLAFTAVNACRLAGQSNTIDVGMMETVMALSQFTTVMWHCAGRIRSRHGNDFWSVPPTNMFRCADGWMYINIVPGFWDAFATALGMPELVLDERFTTNDLRMENRDALHAIIATAVLPLTRDEMLERAAEYRFPLGVVLDFDEVLAAEHLRQRDVWQRVTDGAHEVLSPRPGWVVHDEPNRVRQLASPVARSDGFQPRPETATREAARRASHRAGRVAQGGLHGSTPPSTGEKPALPYASAVGDAPPADGSLQTKDHGDGLCRGPLNGVRILDLTHVWAGPLATRFLADLGATVVKVERPMGRGPREYRGATPIGGWIGGEPGDEPWNANAVFVKLQRNKRSLAMDLKTEAGRETFLELVAAADVVIENFSARAMPSLGLDHDRLREVNPRLICVTAPGYGRTGPWRDRVAFGPSVEPMSGLTAVMGYGRDEPRNTAMALMDAITAVNAASAVMTALRRREDTGKGAFVELALHEGGVALCGPWLIERQLGGTPSPIGNRHPEMAPHGVYRCRGQDNWLALGCRDTDEWRALCALLGGALDPDWDLDARRRHHDIIDRAVKAWTSTREKHAAAIGLQAAGVPAGAVNTTPDMTADPQVQQRGFFVPLEPGPTPMPGSPIHMDGTSSEDWRPCPTLGQDNTAVLSQWLGYSEAHIAALAAAGVTVDKPPR